MAELKLVPTSKVCSKCKLEKPRTDFFYVKKYNKIQAQCKVCHHSKQYSRRNTIETWPRYALKSVRCRARRYGVFFDLELADIFLPTHCPVLGIEFQFAPKGRVAPNTPTIDRIIPELGYVRGNIVVISWEANRLKNDGAVEQLERVLAWMKSVGAK